MAWSSQEIAVLANPPSVIVTCKHSSYALLKFRFLTSVRLNLLQSSHAFDMIIVRGLETIGDFYFCFSNKQTGLQTLMSLYCDLLANLYGSSRPSNSVTYFWWHFEWRQMRKWLWHWAYIKWLFSGTVFASEGVFARVNRPHCTLTSLPVIEDGLRCGFNMSLKKGIRK